MTTYSFQMYELPYGDTCRGFCSQALHTTHWPLELQLAQLIIGIDLNIAVGPAVVDRYAGAYSD